MLRNNKFDALIKESLEDVASSISIATSIKGELSFYNNSDKFYDLASLTKIFTSLLVLKLDFDKVISVNDNVSDFLPNYKHDTKIFELLQHHSGITDEIEVLNVEDVGLIKLGAKKTLYADLNFILLYFILESIGGYQDLLEKYNFINEQIYFPLNHQLNNAHPTEIRADRGPVSGIVHDNKCFKMGCISGHAGLFATLEGISYKITEIISGDFKAYLREMFIQYQTDLRTLGFLRVDELKQTGLFNEDCYFHTGFAGTSILLTSDLDSFVICLTNRIFPTRDNPRIFEFRKKVSDEFYRESKCIN